MNKSQQLKNISHFLSNYGMKYIDKDTVVLQSSESFYFSKTFEIEDNYEKIQFIKDQLQLHLGFSFKGFLGLLYYQFSKNQKKGMKIVRTVYEYERCTLEQQISQRQPDEYFSQDQLWKLLQTVASILQYLQSQNTAYGVLSLNKICFNQGQFYLIDPSAYQINQSFTQDLTFSSPELKQQWKDINYFNSDVYALGVCLLLTACLKTKQSQFDDLIIQIEQRYSEDLAHVLKYMLKENPEERPSYSNIREFIETQLYQDEESLLPLAADLLQLDSEDIPNDLEGCSCTEVQIFDIEEPSNDINDEMSEFDQIKMRILKSSFEEKEISKNRLNQSPIEVQQLDHKSSFFNQQFVKSSLYDTTSFLETSTTLKGISKIKRIKNERLTNVKATSSITFEEEPLWSKRASTIFTDPEFIQSLRNNKMNFRKQETKRQDKQNRMMNY